MGLYWCDDRCECWREISSENQVAGWVMSPRLCNLGDVIRFMLVGLCDRVYVTGFMLSGLRYRVYVIGVCQLAHDVVWVIDWVAQRSDVKRARWILRCFIVVGEQE